MWFFGFSITNTKSLWVFGAIVMVIILTLILKKVIVYLEFRNTRNSCSREICIQTGAYRKGSSSACNWCCGSAIFTGSVIRTYALDELRRATREFRVQIGVGATSFVYLAELEDGRIGAVKRVMVGRGGTKKVFLDEVSVLLRISHPNLVGLMGFCMEKGEQLLLLEYIPNRSLFEIMHTYTYQSSGVLTWSDRMSIAFDIARALDYLHSQADPPIIHRDVKSSNILLIDNHHAKLADFGLCKLGHDTKPNNTTTSLIDPTSIKGSFGYVDISYLDTGLVSSKSDVYSFGVLLLELVTGLKSMHGSSPLSEWTEELRKNSDLSGMLDPKLKGEADFVQLQAIVDLANWALLDKPENRPDMAQIVDKISSCLEPKNQAHLAHDLPV